MSTPAEKVTSKRFIPFRGHADVVRRALNALHIEGNLRLIGETGAGKSTLVNTLDAESRGVERDKIRAGLTGLADSDWKSLNGIPWELYQYSLTRDTNRWDLVATQTLVAGTVQIVPGPILDWLNNRTPGTRKVLFLDEWNYAEAGITSLFNQLADFRRSIRVSEIAVVDQRMYDQKAPGALKPDEWGKRERTENHWLIVAENPYDTIAYAGTNPPNIAQLGRFFPVEVPFMSKSEEIAFLKEATGGKAPSASIDDIVKIADDIRAKFRSHDLHMVLSPRNTLTLAKLLVAYGGRMEPVLETVVEWFPKEDQEVLKSTYFGTLFKKRA